MISRKAPWMRIAAVTVLIGAGASFAVAQTGQRGSAQSAPAAQTAPVSRPVTGGAWRAPSGGLLVASPLTQAECTGIGGKVIDVSASSCTSGKQCVTANDDNTIHYKCISKE